MSKKFYFFILLFLSIIGSVVVFYSSNLVLSDVGNAYGGLRDVSFISSLPAVLFAFEFVAVIVFVVRSYAFPQYFKKTVELYAVLFIVFSALGVVFSIISGAVIYGSFTDPYPFPGYVIAGIAVHFLLMSLGITARVLAALKMKDDECSRKMTVRHVLYTAAQCLLIFLTFNRFGAFLFAFEYVHLGTLYMTFPFYLYLLLPLAMLVMLLLGLFGVFRRHPKAGLAFSSIVCGLNILLFTAVAVIGSHNTAFISVISPALPLERLANMPVEVILQCVILLGTSAYALVRTILVYKESKK